MTLKDMSHDFESRMTGHMTGRDVLRGIQGIQGVTYRTSIDLVLMPSKALGTSWPNGLLLSRLRTEDTRLCGLTLIIPLSPTKNI